MKHIVAILFAMVFSLSAFAQDRDKPELTPQQKLFVANAAVALLTGWFVLPAAILSGQKEGLCHVLEGHQTPSSYNPNPDQIDQCPKGVWLRIIPYLGKD